MENLNSLLNRPPQYEVELYAWSTRPSSHTNFSWPWQVVDPVKASYGVENAYFAVIQLAQTTMRSELGKISLDKTFEERAALNDNIVRSIQ